MFFVLLIFFKLYKKVILISAILNYSFNNIIFTIKIKVFLKFYLFHLCLKITTIIFYLNMIFKFLITLYLTFKLSSLCLFLFFNITKILFLFFGKIKIQSYASHFLVLIVKRSVNYVICICLRQRSKICQLLLQFLALSSLLCQLIHCTEVCLCLV